MKFVPWVDSLLKSFCWQHSAYRRPYWRGGTPGNWNPNGRDGRGRQAVLSSQTRHVLPTLVPDMQMRPPCELLHMSEGQRLGSFIGNLMTTSLPQFCSLRFCTFLYCVPVVLLEHQQPVWDHPTGLSYSAFLFCNLT